MRQRAPLLVSVGAATVTLAATVAFLRLHVSLLVEGLLGAASLVGFIALLFGLLEMILSAVERAIGEDAIDDRVDSGKNANSIGP